MPLRTRAFVGHFDGGLRDDCARRVGYRADNLATDGLSVSHPAQEQSISQQSAPGSQQNTQITNELRHDPLPLCERMYIAVRKPTSRSMVGVKPEFRAAVAPLAALDCAA